VNALVHVAFRSTETGRYLFHAKWPASRVLLIETAAAALGVTVEQFIHDAITSYIAAHHPELVK
jgi:hypothetical protein